MSMKRLRGVSGFINEAEADTAAHGPEARGYEVILEVVRCGTRGGMRAPVFTYAMSSSSRGSAFMALKRISDGGVGWVRDRVLYKICGLSRYYERYPSTLYTLSKRETSDYQLGRLKVPSKLV